MVTLSILPGVGVTWLSFCVSSMTSALRLELGCVVLTSGGTGPSSEPTSALSFLLAAPRLASVKKAWTFISNKDQDDITFSYLEQG